MGTEGGFQRGATPGQEGAPKPADGGRNLPNRCLGMIWGRKIRGGWRTLTLEGGLRDLQGPPKMCKVSSGCGYEAMGPYEMV